jgi:hypothetical protein
VHERDLARHQLLDQHVLVLAELRRGMEHRVRFRMPPPRPRHRFSREPAR